MKNDGVHIADIRWTVRLKDDVTDDALSLAEKEILNQYMALRLLFPATDALHLKWDAIYRIQAETRGIQSHESSRSCRLEGRRILSIPLANTDCVDENG